MPTWLNEYQITSTYKTRYTTVSIKDVIIRLRSQTRDHQWPGSYEAKSSSGLFKETERENVPLFALLQTIDHGVVPYCSDDKPAYRPSFRFTLGSIVMGTKHIQRIHSSAGLHIPIELLVEEIPVHITYKTSSYVEEFLGTVVSYMLPSSVIAAKEKAVEMDETTYNTLLCATRWLDTLFEDLVEDICSTNDDRRASLGLEDPSLAMDQAALHILQSQGTSMVRRAPDKIEATKGKEINYSSLMKQLGPGLKGHALQRHIADWIEETNKAKGIDSKQVAEDSKQLVEDSKEVAEKNIWSWLESVLQFKSEHRPTEGENEE